MDFLPIPQADDLSAEALSARARLIESHGRISNLRAALLGHVPSFSAYLEWYTLKDELAAVIGERAVSFFSYAISDEYGCDACSLFFRRVLEGAGEDPGAIPAAERDRLLVEFGREVVRAPHSVPDRLYEDLSRHFAPAQRVLLVAFAGLMVATNVANSVGRVPVDPDLHRAENAEPELAMNSLEAGAE
jgi:alkylhydroperoxidase family enzyme